MASPMQARSDAGLLFIVDAAAAGFFAMPSPDQLLAIIIGDSFGAAGVVFGAAFFFGAPFGFGATAVFFGAPFGAASTPDMIQDVQPELMNRRVHIMNETSSKWLQHK